MDSTAGFRNITVSYMKPSALLSPRMAKSVDTSRPW
jgi:hypothetical protein